MNPDLGLREWLATNVAGYGRIVRDADGYVYYRSLGGALLDLADLPAYELEIGPAFEVVEAMRSRGYRLSLLCWDRDDAEEVCVEFQRWRDAPGGVPKGGDAFGEAEHPHLPRAICLAAKAALQPEAARA